MTEELKTLLDAIRRNKINDIPTIVDSLEYIIESEIKTKMERMKNVEADY